MKVILAIFRFYQSNPGICFCVWPLLPASWDDDESLGQGLSSLAVLIFGGHIIPYCEGLSCVLKMLRRSLASMHLDISSISPNCNNQNCLQTLLNVSWGTKSLLVKNDCLRKAKNARLKTTWTTWKRNTHYSNLNFYYVKPLKFGGGGGKRVCLLLFVSLA